MAQWPADEHAAQHRVKAFRLPARDKVRLLRDAAKAALTDGSLVIFKGPLNDNAGKVIIAPGASQVQTDVTLEKMAYLVEGVKGSIP